MDYSLYHEAEKKVGGKFKLAAILQKRIVELMRGDKPLITLDSENLKEIALHEILQDKIELILDDSSLEALETAGEDKYPLYEY
jgi:DNA-directed RNA polymerase subunit K/omega